MTSTEQAAFNLGVTAGLQAAIKILSDCVRNEHNRFEAAFNAFDDDTTHEALIRRSLANEILGNLIGIERGNETVNQSPGFNPHSDLPFETVEEEHYCQTCGSFDDLEFAADPYASEIGGDDTPGWYCDYCMTNSAMEI